MNRNAEQLIQMKPDPRWYATKCEEMRAFNANNILFGIKTLPERRLYWSKDSFLSVPSIQKIMSRKRFEKFQQYLHLNNHENMLPRGNQAYNKLFWVQTLFDVISRAFGDKYRPSKFVSIDEAMVKYKGRLGFKQSNKQLYLSDWSVHRQRRHQSEPGLGNHVVSNLVRDLHGKNYHIFCDNFFTSVRLAEDLPR